ncbi:MAG: hypothetical protein VKJ09_15555, partial [Leptolyngbya sp.]|nr:hypothetical protein [Leptolyngbya sp.]
LHLPFVTEDDYEAAFERVDCQSPPDWFALDWERADLVSVLCSPVAAFNLMAWSAARCARVSVKNFRTDDTDRKKDYETFMKLVSDTPKHSSPLEHQAVAMDHWSKSYPGSNLSQPWFQFRKMVPDETAWEFQPSGEEVAGWNVPDDVFGGTPGVDW